MKDYLWNKEGSAPEIVALEKTLGEFKASARNCPRPPAPVVETTRSVLNRFRPALLMPAMAGAVLVLFLLLPSGNGPSESASLGIPKSESQIVPAKPAPPVSIPLPSRVNPTNPQNVARAANKTGTPIKRKVRKRRKVLRKRTVTTPRIKAKESPEPLLTAEEKEAYDQLIEALTITSSKLKIVKEKVDGPIGSFD